MLRSRVAVADELVPQQPRLVFGPGLTEIGCLKVEADPAEVVFEVFVDTEVDGQ